MTARERRHRGDGEGHLRSWYHHVDLGQLCGIMRDVPPHEWLSWVLDVVLQDRKSDLPWWTQDVGSPKTELEVKLTLINGVCLACLALSCLPSLLGRHRCSTEP